MIWLGLRRSFGHHAGTLRCSGIYALTRNPQAVAFMIGVVGYVVLWPSWRGAVAVGLLAAILHVMIVTEEEYLKTAYGDEYLSYTWRVPRYLGIPRNQ